MEIKRFDLITEIEFEALRLLLASDPDPEGNATMKQMQSLAILLKQALGDDKYELRHDVLRIITGQPINTQYGLSFWEHSQLINYMREEIEDKDGKKKWAVSIRGRRIIDECARVAEAIIDESEDGMDIPRLEAGVWDMWNVHSEVAA